MRKLTDRLESAQRALRFETSKSYWEDRYVSGGTSGAGSYGRLAEFKSRVLNEIVTERRVQSVVEFGCGDGAQLSLAKYPTYLGVDVSPAAVDACKAKFAHDTTKSFVTLDAFRASHRMNDLALSLDVVYHLIEDPIFEDHMADLFQAASKFVAIYSSDSAHIPAPAPHVRHRNFTAWIEKNRPEWQLTKVYRNPYPYRWWNRRNTSHCDLFLYTTKSVVTG